MNPPEYSIRLLRAAEDDFTEIITYIAADKPSAAEALATKIEKDLKLLCKNPRLGRIPNEEELMKIFKKQEYISFFNREVESIREKIMIGRKI